MSDRWLLVLAASLLPAAAAAQDTRADLDRLLALRQRVRSIDSARTHERNLERARSAALRIGTVYQSGTVRLIGYGPDSVNQGAVHLADSTFTAFGAIPTEFVAGTVFAQIDVAGRDSLLAMAGPAVRVLDVDVARMQASSDAVWPLLLAAGTAYRAGLDAAWREWLPSDLGMSWTVAREGVAAMRALTEDVWSAGQGCLASQLHECRRWLALDTAADPYAARYSAADLRRVIRRVGVLQSDSDYRSCVDGSDAACARMPARHGRFIAETIPSGEAARVSVVRWLLDREGGAAVRRALADSAGSIGERFARASGTSIDPMVAQWRLFVLRRGHADRVQASWADGLMAVLVAGLLAALAARSGRWR